MFTGGSARQRRHNSVSSFGSTRALFTRARESTPNHCYDKIVAWLFDIRIVSSTVRHALWGKIRNVAVPGSVMTALGQCIIVRSKSGLLILPKEYGASRYVGGVTDEANLSTRLLTFGSVHRRPTYLGTCVPCELASCMVNTANLTH